MGDTQSQTTQSSSYSGQNGYDWANLLLGAYGAYQQQHPKKPKFTQVPLTPQQQQVWNTISQYMQPGGSPTANYLGPIMENLMQGYTANSWTSPQTLAVPGVPGTGGMTGYPGAPKSSIDWKSLVPFFNRPGQGAGQGANGAHTPTHNTATPAGTTNPDFVTPSQPTAMAPHANTSENGGGYVPLNNDAGPELVNSDGFTPTMSDSGDVGNGLFGAGIKPRNSFPVPKESVDIANSATPQGAPAGFGHRIAAWFHGDGFQHALANGGWQAVTAGATALFGPLAGIAVRGAQMLWNHYHKP